MGHILLNTTNKSEMAVGYGTLYGDMCGGLSVIGDVYKTQVYALCEYLNSMEKCIPDSIIEKPPSAELRPDQKDSDSLPPYDLLDKVLYRFIEERKSISDLVEEGFDESLVKRVFKMLNASEYKRKQAAPVIRVSSKAFGPGRRMPIVAFYG
jgi:NAD+ synthase (glutamine-hydrolysing)